MNANDEPWDLTGQAWRGCFHEAGEIELDRIFTDRLIVNF